MVLEPSLYRPDLAIGQQVDDPVLFEIADDRSETMAAPPSEVIEADDLGVGRLWRETRGHLRHRGGVLHAGSIWQTGVSEPLFSIVLTNV